MCPGRDNAFTSLPHNYRGARRQKTPVCCSAGLSLSSSGQLCLLLGRVGVFYHTSPGKASAGALSVTVCFAGNLCTNPVSFTVRIREIWKPLLQRCRGGRDVARLGRVLLPQRLPAVLPQHLPPCAGTGTRRVAVTATWAAVPGTA